MSHVCCVKLCESKEGGKNNPRCVFRFSRDSSNYIAVLNAIGHHLKENKSAQKFLYVCDLHYEKSCILTSGIKIWKDGVETTIPRKNRRLKENSIPTIFTFPTLTPTPVKESSVQILRQADPENCNQPQNFQIKSEQSDDCMDHEDEEQEHRDQEQQPRENVQEHEQKEQEPFTRNTIIERWKSLVQENKTPAHWGLSNTSLGLALIYGDGDQAGTRTILVKDDMSFEVRYKGTLGQIPGSFEKLKSFEELQGIIEYVTFLRVCEGIEELPLSCENIFFIPKPHSSSTKCANCQKKARYMKSNEYRRAKRALVKEKKYTRNLTMKCKRAMKKDFNKWVVNTGRDDIIFEKRRSYRVCDLHFSEGSKFPTCSNRSNLKVGAVPTLYLSEDNPYIPYTELPVSEPGSSALGTLQPDPVSQAPDNMTFGTLKHDSVSEGIDASFLRVSKSYGDENLPFNENLAFLFGKKNMELTACEKQLTNSEATNVLVTTPFILVKATFDNEEPILLKTEPTPENSRIILDFMNGIEVWDADYGVSLKANEVIGHEVAENLFGASDFDDDVIEIPEKIEPEIETPPVIEKPNLSNHCRICMEEGENMTEIETLKADMGMNSLFIYFDINVMEEKGVTNKICAACITKLETINDFRKLAMSSFKFMLDILEIKQPDDDIIINNDMEVEISTNPVENITNNFVLEDITNSSIKDPKSTGKIIDHVIVNDPEPETVEIPIHPTVDEKFDRIKVQVDDETEQEVYSKYYLDCDTDSVINGESTVPIPQDTSTFWDTFWLKYMVENNAKVRVYYVSTKIWKLKRVFVFVPFVNFCDCCQQNVLGQNYKEHLQKHTSENPRLFCPYNCKQQMHYSHWYRKHSYRQHKSICKNCSDVIKFIPFKNKYSVTCGTCESIFNPLKLEGYIAPNSQTVCPNCKYLNDDKSTSCQQCYFDPKIFIIKPTKIPCKKCRNDVEVKEGEKHITCVICDTVNLVPNNVLKCNRCENHFLRWNLLITHLDTHSEQSLVCFMCGIKCSSPLLLRKHIREHNRKAQRRKSKRIFCKICQKKYVNNHECIKQEWKCSLCQKICSTKRYLAHHYAKHVGTKHSCACGKSFTHKDLLREHQRNIHYSYVLPRRPTNSLVE